MRILRTKIIRKYLLMYRLTFGIDSPYNIILENEFILHCIKYKINIPTRIGSLLHSTDMSQNQNNDKKIGKGPLPKALQKKMKFYVLKSTQKLHEDIIKNSSSNDEKKELSNNVLNIINNICIVLNDDEFLNNDNNLYDNYRKFIDEEFNDDNKNKKRKYFVACQNNKLRGQLAGLPGVPLLYMNQVSLVLEPPSKATLRYTGKFEVNKVNVPIAEQESLNKINQILKPKTLSVISEDKNNKENKDIKLPRHKKKSSAPNPLANKKPDKNSSKTKKKLANKYKK